MDSLTENSFVRGFHRLPNSIHSKHCHHLFFQTTCAIGPILISAVSRLRTSWGPNMVTATLRTVRCRRHRAMEIRYSPSLLLLIRMSSDALVVIALVAVVSSLAIALISTDESGGIADSGKWSEVVLIFLKTRLR